MTNRKLHTYALLIGTEVDCPGWTYKKTSHARKKLGADIFSWQGVPCTLFGCTVWTSFTATRNMTPLKQFTITI